PPLPHAKHHLGLFDLLIVVVVAILVGTGAYFFFSWQVSQTRTALQQQLTSVDQQKTTLMNQLQDQNLTLTKLQAAKLAAEDKLANQAGAMNYDGWQTYTPGTADAPVAFTIRYPDNLTVNELVTTADKAISGKNSRCAEFSSRMDRETLAVCYRQTNDATATTWVIAGLGYLELAKVGIQLPFGNRTITEKTLFGDRGAVKTIIYAQNIADDETGFPARIKLGDLYFSAAVTSEQGISSSQQALYDQILASLQLTRPLAQ
ncbi:MAG: hypothetical protein AAB817_00625, partial [Patescibacteria group bacterium]